MLARLVKYIRWYMTRNTPQSPSNEALARMINDYLGQPNRRAHGEIIRFRLNGYQYYITRSPVEPRR